MQAESILNPYLQQEVLTASPIRLRWMLVKRAEELCGVIGPMWQAGDSEQAAQWLIRLRDILGELLEGVRDAAHPLSKSITDFYVFLLQTLGEVEISQSVPRLETMRELLAIDAETWRLALDKSVRESGDSTEDNFKLNAPSPHCVAPLPPESFADTTSNCGFSLEI